MANMLNLKKWVGGGGVDQQQVGMAIRAPDGANNIKLQISGPEKFIGL